MLTCLIISSAIAILLLVGMIGTLQTQNAVQAERLRLQEQQIQVLQQQERGNGCVGTMLLIVITLLLGALLLAGLAAGA
jgi:hypothetical protein